MDATIYIRDSTVRDTTVGTFNDNFIVDWKTGVLDLTEYHRRDRERGDRIINDIIYAEKLFNN